MFFSHRDTLHNPQPLQLTAHLEIARWGNGYSVPTEGVEGVDQAVGGGVMAGDVSALAKLLLDVLCVKQSAQFS